MITVVALSDSEKRKYSTERRHLHMHVCADKHTHTDTHTSVPLMTPEKKGKKRIGSNFKVSPPNSCHCGKYFHIMVL